MALPRKPIAREMGLEFLKERARGTRPTQLYVRINPLSSTKSQKDLAAIAAGGPDGIVLPKCSGAQEVLQLSGQLDLLESRHGVATGSTSVVAIAGETPLGVLSAERYARTPAARLAGLTWGTMGSRR